MGVLFFDFSSVSFSAVVPDLVTIVLTIVTKLYCRILKNTAV